MKYVLVLFLSLTCSAVAFAEPLRSKFLRDLIGSEIDETAGWGWNSAAAEETQGSIWSLKYDGDADRFEFEVLRSEDFDKNGAIDWMNVSVYVPCGSEYDESELSGTCDVNIKKYPSGWKVTKAECECDSGLK